MANGMNTYERHFAKRWRLRRARWLVTGVRGFIGSHLLEALLQLDQRVVGLDNFATGHRSNLDEVRRRSATTAWAQLHVHRRRHPRSGRLPRALAEASTSCCTRRRWARCRARSKIRFATNGTNVDGFLNMLVAARDAGVQRFVYAASSSTYGDHPGLPKVEDRIGRPLSPYAVTKYVNELYADVFARCYGLADDRACATSTCSARARIPTARTPR